MSWEWNLEWLEELRRRVEQRRDEPPAPPIPEPPGPFVLLGPEIESAERQAREEWMYETGMI